MIGLAELAKGLAKYLAEQTGIPVFAGRVENPVYPCCLIEAAGKTQTGTRQIERTVTVTLTCYGSRKREREEGLQLLDRMESTVVGGFLVCGRRFCPQQVESSLNGKELPQIRFALQFFDMPKSAEDTGMPKEKMASLKLRMEAEREE